MPARYRGHIAAVSTSSFVHGMNDILLIGAAVAFAGAVATLALIRQQDLADASQRAIGQAPARPEATPAIEHVA